MVVNINNFISKMVKKCSINLGTLEKTIEFNKSLRTLINFLFSFAFGFGLNQLKGIFETFTYQSLFTLVVAFIAILLSWWGYNWATIMDTSEGNSVSYVIDILLLVDYWVLINFHDNMHIFIYAIFVMFLLYFLWELIRYYEKGRDNEVIKNACTINLIFTFFLCVILILDSYAIANDNYNSSNISQSIPALIILITIIFYRVIIHQVYNCKLSITTANINFASNDFSVLIAKSKSVAENAQVHLSNFRVGAAILTESGAIHTGCNIEFDNYSNTIHAEESAISSLFTNGFDKPIAISVYTSTDFVNFPCGMCRQSLYELNSDLLVIACNDNENAIKTISEILPEGFKL